MKHKGNWCAHKTLGAEVVVVTKIQFVPHILIILKQDLHVAWNWLCFLLTQQSIPLPFSLYQKSGRHKAELSSELLAPLVCFLFRFLKFLFLSFTSWRLIWPADGSRLNNPEIQKQILCATLLTVRITKRCVWARKKTCLWYSCGDVIM